MTRSLGPWAPFLTPADEGAYAPPVDRWALLASAAFEDRFNANEVSWARGRLTDRIYVSRSFELDLRASQDHGQMARYVTKVFDEQPFETQPDSQREEWVVMTTPGGRKQLKLQVARDSGRVREISLQKVPTDPESTKLEPLLTLDREASARLIDLVRALDYIPVEGETSVRVDDQMLRDLFADPSANAGLVRQGAGAIPRPDQGGCDS